MINNSYGFIGSKVECTQLALRLNVELPALSLNVLQMTSYLPEGGSSGESQLIIVSFSKRGLPWLDHAVGYHIVFFIEC